MAHLSYDFLAPPKPHHHVSRLVVLCIILAGLVVIGWLYEFLVQPRAVSYVPLVSPSPTGLTDKQREAMASQPSNATANTSLTDAQRAAIASKKPATRPTASSGQTLTDTQRRAIMSGTATMTNF